MQHLRTSGEHLARCALQSVFLFAVAQMLQVPRICRVQTRPLPGLRSGQKARPHAAFASCRYALDTTHAGGPLVWAERSQSHRTRARCVGGASSEQRARHSGLWRRVLQEWPHEAVGTWRMASGGAQRRNARSRQSCTARSLASTRTSLRRRAWPSTREGCWAVRSTRTSSTRSATGGKARNTAPEVSSSTRRPGDGSESEPTKSGHNSFMQSEGPRDNAARARRHDLSALHPSVAQVEQSYSARTSFLGWLAKFLGRLHAHVKFRGWSDVAPRVKRQRRTLPGKCSNASHEGREPHTPCFRARTRWRRRATSGSAGDAGSTSRNV